MAMTADTPTIVFVHGAWADATGFGGSIRSLRDRGYTAIGAANPLRHLTGDAASLAALLGTIPGPIVLVGHSYGGAVLSSAAAGNQQVRALVFVAGWMPDEGESIQQLLEESEVFGDSLVPAALRPVPFTNPDGSEVVDLYLDRELFPETFAADAGVANSHLDQVALVSVQPWPRNGAVEGEATHRATVRRGDVHSARRKRVAHIGPAGAGAGQLGHRRCPSVVMTTFAGWRATGVDHCVISEIVSTGQPAVPPCRADPGDQRERWHCDGRCTNHRPRRRGDAGAGHRQPAQWGTKNRERGEPSGGCRARQQQAVDDGERGRTSGGGGAHDDGRACPHSRISGAVEQSALQGGANLTHVSDPRFDTADFADTAPGNLRADYVLPSKNLRIADAAVFWPLSTDPLFRLVGTFPFPSSDHRLVWVDVRTFGGG